MRREIKCVGKYCSHCQEAILVNEDAHPLDRKYMCQFYQKKHKEINARNCGHFKCDYPYYMICDDCIAK